MGETAQGLKDSVTSKGTETLSQFLARVLDQLSLSAWLPSAALVLAAGFSFSLRAVLDDSRSPIGVIPKVSESVTRLADSGLGGALLALGAVVVFTMMTQAFAFEAIRVLEGYWGTQRWVERLADSRCGHFATIRTQLERRRLEAVEKAWLSAEKVLIEQELGRQRVGEAHLTPDMVEVLRAAVLGREPIVKLTDKAAALKILKTKWEPLAAPDLIRRRNNLAKDLRDYPTPGRELPTRLGNIMRHFEDATHEGKLESYVVAVFDTLPLSLQVSHDDQRNRLDLYASMVFVLLFSGTISAVALYTHPAFAIVIVIVSWLAALASYWAAMASARAYGGVLLAVVAHVRREAAPARTGA